MKVLIEMGQAATFKGYGPEQGYAKTRDAIAAYYKRNGVDVDADAIFISDGAKAIPETSLSFSVTTM